MDHRTECSFWKINKLLLMCFGLWPYQSKISRRCSYLILAVWMLSCLIPLLKGFAEEIEPDAAIFFESIVALTVIVGGVSLNGSTRIHLARIKDIYDHIAMDWQTITEPDEIAILKNYSRQGRSLMLLFAGSFIAGALWFMSLTYIPFLVYKGAPISYLRYFPYYSKTWIINENFHLLQVLLHEDMGLLYVMFVYIATTSMFITSVTHICGMFEIVCCRLRKLTDTSKIVEGKSIYDLEQIPNKTKAKDNDTVISELQSIVSKHKEAIKEIHILSVLFGPTLFVVESCILLTLAMLIFDFSYNMERSMLLTARIIFVAIMFAEYLFYLNFGGQQIIDYSNKVLTSAYFMEWYLLSNDARKMLLMIQKRSNRGDILNAGIMTLSLENFTAVIKLSWSFACMLLSSHKKA